MYGERWEGLRKTLRERYAYFWKNKKELKGISRRYFRSEIIRTPATSKFIQRAFTAGVWVSLSNCGTNLNKSPHN